MFEHSIPLCFCFDHSICLSCGRSLCTKQNYTLFKHLTFTFRFGWHHICVFYVLFLSVSFRVFDAFLQKNFCCSEHFKFVFLCDCFYEHSFLCFPFSPVFAIDLFGTDDGVLSNRSTTLRISEQLSFPFQLFCDVRFCGVKVSHKIFFEPFPHGLFHNAFYFHCHFSLFFLCFGFINFPCFASLRKKQTKKFKRKKQKPFRRRKNVFGSSEETCEKQMSGRK